jgi:Na+-transporting NADH:ubiquinone oxidoreductase subunit NqrE
MAYLDLFVRAAFVENLALSFFLGMCMFLAVSQRIATAIGFGAAVFVVQTLTVPLNQLIYSHLLRPGAWAWAGLPELDLSFLGLISYIGVIAAFVQILEMAVDRRSARRRSTARGAASAGRWRSACWRACVRSSSTPTSPTVCAGWE